MTASQFQLSASTDTVLVCGGRGYHDQARVNEVLGSWRIGKIVEGDAPGADHCASWYAREKGISLATYAADWKSLGRAAGPVRNRTMLLKERPTLVVAFPGGNGTRDMVNQSIKAGVPVLIIDAPEWREKPEWSHPLVAYVSRLPVLPAVQTAD